MIRNGEWQPSNHDVGKRIARHINAHPKTVSAKKDTPRSCPELFEQFSSSHSLPLDKQIHPVLGKERLHFFCELQHYAITGEKNKSAAFCFEQKMSDPMSKRFRVACIARIGHFPYDEQFHLTGKIEGTSELQRSCGRSANAITKIGKVWPAHCQSRAVQHT